jgi:hypothetical protein
VYFHCLIATHNDPAGVQRSGQPRSISRKRWQAGELNGLLDDAATPALCVFQEYTMYYITLRYTFYFLLEVSQRPRGHAET